MNSFALNYFFALINSLIPLALGSILIAISCIIKPNNQGIVAYSKIIGVVISVLSLIAIIYNLGAMIGQYI